MKNSHTDCTATVKPAHITRGKFKTPKRQPTYLLDSEDKTPLVRVQLAGEGGSALINRADFERLVIDLGLSPNWTCNMGHVRAPLNSTKGHLISVARTIMGAGSGQRVSYANGERTDLRRKNLLIEKVSGNRAKRNDAALLAKGFKTRNERTNANPVRIAA